MKLEEQQRRRQSYLSTEEATVLVQAKRNTSSDEPSISSSSPDADAAPENASRHAINRSERQLLRRTEVHEVLNLSEEQVQFLINTRQITAMRIAGEERFDSRDIDRLIDGYKATASRRPL